MSRDMKTRRNQPAKKKSAGGTLIGMFIGLVLGVGAAAGVVWYMNKSPLPFVDKSPPPRSEAAAAAANGKPAQPLALPGKPGDAIPEKRFQFYDILPGKTDAVPDKEGKAVTVAKEDAKKAVVQQVMVQDKTYYRVRVGPYTKLDELNKTRTELAKSGIDASLAKNTKE